MKVPICIYVFLIQLLFFNVEYNAKPLLKPRVKRNAYRNVNRLWPKGIVPYTIHEDYNTKERAIIEEAINVIHAQSCVRFKKHSTEKAWVEILPDTGCRAVVGYIGRYQKLTLGYGCIWVARVLHELFHVLGFFHEHTRPDRDEFVIINNDNIKSASIGNFRKISEDKVTTFGLPYDYHSVLHYHDREFAVNRSVQTIIPKQPGVIIGKAQELSPMDILKLNKLYRCPKKRLQQLDKINDEGSGDTDLEDNYIW